MSRFSINRLWIVKLFTVAAAVLAVLVIAYGLYLLVIGQTITSVNEGETVQQIILVPHIGGIFPLVGGIVVLAGLLLRRPLVAWPGFVLVAAFSVLFLFGIGGVLLPITVALLLLLTTMTWLEKSAKDTSLEPANEQNEQS